MLHEPACSTLLLWYVKQACALANAKHTWESREGVPAAETSTAKTVILYALNGKPYLLQVCTTTGSATGTDLPLMSGWVFQTSSHQSWEAHCVSLHPVWSGRSRGRQRGCMTQRTEAAYPKVGQTHFCLSQCSITHNKLPAFSTRTATHIKTGACCCQRCLPKSQLTSDMLLTLSGLCLRSSPRRAHPTWVAPITRSVWMCGQHRSMSSLPCSLSLRDPCARPHA